MPLRPKVRQTAAWAQLAPVNRSASSAAAAGGQGRSRPLTGRPAPLRQSCLRLDDTILSSGGAANRCLLFHNQRPPSTSSLVLPAACAFLAFIVPFTYARLIYSCQKHYSNARGISAAPQKRRAGGSRRERAWYVCCIDSTRLCFNIL